MEKNREKRGEGREERDWEIVNTIERYKYKGVCKE